MLTTIIFSKDRPLQLDLTLKSLIQNWPINNKIEVIYNVSSGYEVAYKTLEKEYNFVEFTNEEDFDGFQIFLRTSVNFSKNPYLMFLTDDNIFYRKSKTTESDLNDLFSRNITCLSLRLGINITERPGFIVKQPKFTRVGWNHLTFNRMEILATDYWNYPLSVDGHIFKKEVIGEILDELEILAHNSDYGVYTNPNQLEQYFQRYFFEVPVLIACELYSCVVNSPNNRVQNTIPNKHGDKFPYDQSYLLSLFNEGFRIKLEDLDFSNIVCPHQECNILRNLI